MKLTDYSQNMYSQFGEDGVISKIFELIGTQSKLCIDIGSWDGVLYSNVCNLYRNGWRAVLIEGNKKKFEELVKNTHWYECECINEYVHNMEIVNQHKEIDLLNIDIDGNDYYLFKDLKARPRVIICEYNPTFPQHMHYVNKKDANMGSSALALKILGESKGYTLIAMTDSNCIFVVNELKHKFEKYDIDYKSIYNTNNLTYVITDYSGNYMFSRKPCYGFEKPLNNKFS